MTGSGHHGELDKWEHIGCRVTKDRYNYARWNGGGGLSLRKVSRIQQVLNFQSRQDDEHSEDKWLTDRIKVLRGIKLPKPEVEKTFAVEGVFDEKPMGFHLPSSNQVLLRDVWDDPGKRRKIFDYCPEVKMLMNMKLERERCEEGSSEADKEKENQKQMEKELQEQIAEQAESEEEPDEDGGGK